jgi:hypothetical protein
MFANSADQIWLSRLLCFGKILHPLATIVYFLANVWATRGLANWLSNFWQGFVGSNLRSHTKHMFCDFVIRYNGALEKA